MMTVRKAVAEDFLNHSWGNDVIENLMTPEMAELRAKDPTTFIGFWNDVPAFICGVAFYWPGRGEVWASLGKNTGPIMVQITRAIKKELAKYDNVKRLELSVECDFTEGHRWAKILGFEKESERLKAYYPDGKDATMYVRVN